MQNPPCQLGWSSRIDQSRGLEHWAQVELENQSGGLGKSEAALVVLHCMQAHSLVGGPGVNDPSGLRMGRQLETHSAQLKLPCGVTQQTAAMP